MLFITLLLKPFKAFVKDVEVDVKGEENMTTPALLVSMPLGFGLGWWMGKIALAKGWITGFWSTLLLYMVAMFSGAFVYAFVRAVLVLVFCGTKSTEPTLPKGTVNTTATVK